MTSMPSSMAKVKTVFTEGITAAIQSELRSSTPHRFPLGRMKSSSMTQGSAMLLDVQRFDFPQHRLKNFPDASFW
jgi:hypothetical protein